MPLDRRSESETGLLPFYDRMSKLEGTLHASPKRSSSSLAGTLTSDRLAQMETLMPRALQHDTMHSRPVDRIKVNLTPMEMELKMCPSPPLPFSTSSRIRLEPFKERMKGQASGGTLSSSLPTDHVRRVERTMMGRSRSQAFAPRQPNLEEVKASIKRRDLAMCPAPPLPFSSTASMRLQPYLQSIAG
eukprot:TRINITY_DN82009_c0_g1_i1.p1 TRINITY_DN82009_c0_g1~~TRINITY_DN82009_c0_g1_i1.p1  ORF type:complete len:188 (+),score=19.82 TRINITY_DN82009_c0_g1_i1:82-645(+)